MKRYVIDEEGRAMNVPHYPYLYTDETGTKGYELNLPRNLWYRIPRYEAELIVGDTFIAYGGKYPRKYVMESSFAPPETEAMRIRKLRKLERWGVPTKHSRIPAWRYPLVPIEKS